MASCPVIVVLVPYRADGGHRDRLWSHLLRVFWPQFGFPVCVGTHDDGGRFNRSAALNAAAGQQAWDFAVIADADTWVPRAQLDAALALCADNGRLTSALSGVIELDRRCTDALLAGGALGFTDLGVAAVRAEELAVQSSMLVVSRRLWDDVGGFDERFAGGWGGEDNAFWRACSIMGGAPNRVPGFAFHLWHEPAAENVNRADRGYQANLARWHRYRVARNERQLRAVRNAP